MMWAESVALIRLFFKIVAGISVVAVALLFIDDAINRGENE